MCFGKKKSSKNIQYDDFNIQDMKPAMKPPKFHIMTPLEEHRAQVL